MIYADYNATAPLRPEAREAMLNAMEIGANPSSIHAAGRKARRIVESAREQIGGAIGSRGEDIVFTSGGTEANSLALHGAVALIETPHILFAGIEHPAVRDPVNAMSVPYTELSVLQNGQLDLNHLYGVLENLKEKGDTPLLSLMLANNETGVVQPVSQAASMVRDAGGYVHCDAVQGLGKIPVKVAMMGVDYLSLSAHKCGGPQGIGALWLRPGAPLKPQQIGGGQERSIRSGTENLIGIAGFGAAAETSARLENVTTLSARRDGFEAKLLAKAAITVFSRAAERLPGTSCFGLEGLKSDTLVMSMDLSGIAVSAGAACSSGKVRKSGVLSSMGVSDALASSAIRTSFGWNSKPDDFDAVADAWLKAAERITPDAFREMA